MLRHPGGLPLFLALFFVTLITSCSPATQKTPGVPTFTPIPPTATVTSTPTLTATPTVTPTAPQLPAGFTTKLLNPLDVPHTYIADTCQYLKMRWDPNNSAPGTVVMPIMFHSITDGEVTQDSQISSQTLQFLVRDLREQGFEAITLQQFQSFVYSNAKIPPHSVLLIVDDRKTASFYNTHFRPLYQQYGWTVVNAWISAVETTQQLWDENAQLEKEGWVDHQAHGVVHNIPISPFVSDAYIKNELEGSISAIQSHFGKTPIAFIWPGGGFTTKAVTMAREAEYKLGFSTNPRGPIMFNWVPLADKKDPGRDTWLEEGTMNDPLMVLPRFWSTDARQHIDQVRQIGDQAAAYAQQNKSIEIAYYNSACAPVTGLLPTIAP